MPREKEIKSGVLAEKEANAKLQMSEEPRVPTVGTKGVSQNHLLSFDDNKVLKIVNWKC